MTQKGKLIINWHKMTTKRQKTTAETPNDLKQTSNDDGCKKKPIVSKWTKWPKKKYLLKHYNYKKIQEWLQRWPKQPVKK